VKKRERREIKRSKMKKTKKAKMLTAEEKNLATMSKATNYNRWLFRNISPYLGQRILEIGGGVGSMTRMFLGRKLIVSTDVTDYNISHMKRQFSRNKNFHAVKTDISRGVSGLNRFRFDTVVCINVLEHIKDDVATIRNAGSLLDKKGHLVLLVPAFSRIYGTIDRSDSHFRRYDKAVTIKKVEKAGFRVIKSFYMNVPGFFGWYYHGKLLKAKTHPEGDISFFDKLVPIFSFFEKIFKPPFGLSLIVIAEKAR
jgi:2-polyprenyl-3-methyl-5-hydroxy-6-metoxy-1,4-benzoquinol methylase